ncbi:MFS transporter [Lentzea cavernae]|uniref:MFS transporter n=1 Tax=Lentzea cavernae TaxID=2020703 RepID=A0ABQ3M9J5_9PSEU|nr:MFS transporter [Lentzea cavernae]GHH32331.1 MFS transporter [Lentzea cavernae]
MTSKPRSTGQLALASPAGRWLIAVTSLGSGVVFLDGSVVNVALPAIGAELGGGFTTLQWVLDGYLLTLSALLLLGGALGDRYGRKLLFLSGLAVFTVASLGCGLAPSAEVLVAARLGQGVGGAMLVPGSLALIDAVVRPQDRGRAIGAWAGLSGVSTAVGPLLGGWLVDTASWRWVFLLNLPLALLTFVATVRHVPESSAHARSRLDIGGAVAVTLGLGGVTVALIDVPSHGWNTGTAVAAVLGTALLVVFVVIERRHPSPLLPMSMFRSAQFTGANLLTFTIYGALGGGLFLLTLQLQLGLHYSALEAGLATAPITLAILLLSSRIGAVAQRFGPLLPMTAGPALAAIGFVLLSGITTDSSYAGDVLPGVAVFGLGLATTIAPLTSAVLAAVPDDHVGAASGANNAISRVAGLLAIAVLPAAAGIDLRAAEPSATGFAAAMRIAAAACAASVIIALLTIRRGRPADGRTQVVPDHPCQTIRSSNLHAVPPA